MNRRQKNEEIRRGYENIQTAQRDGFTLYVVQDRRLPKRFLVKRGRLGILFVKSGGNVHREVSQAFSSMRTKAGFTSSRNEQVAKMFNEVFDVLERQNQTGAGANQ